MTSRDEKNGLPELGPGERIDALGRDGLRIIQNPGLFCFTTDVYLLAAFARPDPDDAVLELGSGSGAIVLLLAGRTKATRVVGLEIQEALVELARRNMALNGLAGRAEVIQHDLRVERALAPERFDLVVANPPYISLGAGCWSRHEPMALAKIELACTLADVVQAAARWLKDHGRFVLMHRPERLPEILAELLRLHLSPKQLVFIHPKPAEAANTILVEARSGARPGLTVGPPLFVRDERGAFTREMEEIFAGRWPRAAII